MVDLGKYYNRRVHELGHGSHLLQVGHSINGSAISQLDVDVIINDITNGLSLNKNDSLLDLCCGNGAITHKLSKTCRNIVAIDLSKELISIAKKQFSAENIIYEHRDVYSLTKQFGHSLNINKVLMFAALQHFKKNDLADLLLLIFSICGSDTRIFFGFVTDNSYKWKFHNSPKKKILYYTRRLLKYDKMGTWWQKDYIAEVCHSLNLTCTFQSVLKGCYGYPYRFHCTIQKEEGLS